MVVAQQHALQEYVVHYEDPDTHNLNKCTATIAVQIADTQNWTNNQALLNQLGTTQTQKQLQTFSNRSASLFLN